MVGVAVHCKTEHYAHCLLSTSLCFFIFHPMPLYVHVLLFEFSPFLASADRFLGESDVQHWQRRLCLPKTYKLPTVDTYFMKCQHSSQVAAHTNTHVSIPRQEYNNKYKCLKLANVHAATVAAVSVKLNHYIANATTNSNDFLGHILPVVKRLHRCRHRISKDTFAWCQNAMISKRKFRKKDIVTWHTHEAGIDSTHDTIPTSQAVSSVYPQRTGRTGVRETFFIEWRYNQTSRIFLAAAQRSVVNTFKCGLEDISTSNKLFGVCIDVKCRLIFRFHWLETTTRICVHTLNSTTFSSMSFCYTDKCFVDGGGFGRFLGKTLI